MKQKLKLIFSMLLCSVLLCMTGCWDNKELDGLSIVTGVGIDTSKNPGQLDLSFQIATVQNGSKKEDGGNNTSPYLIRETKNRFIIGGMDTLRYGNSRELFLQHNQVILFGSGVAKAGVKPYLDTFMRNAETRMEVWILVAKDDARSILSTQTEQDKIPSIALSRMIQNERAISPYTSTNMLQFTSRLVDHSTAPVTLVVERKEENKQQTLNFCGMAVFKDDIMVGMLDMYQMQGYMLSMGEVDGGSVELITELGNASLKITKSICKKEIQLDDQGNITYKLKINTNLSIGELQNFRSMDINKVIPLLNEKAKADLETKIKACFAESQRLRSDIYGIGAHIHKYHPKQWKNMENAWAAIYPKIRLELEVETNLSSSGKISESLNMREGHE
ncbi:Ger(x)C family spore germination protein [Faecalispora anaeroviscerum]|uniref:Ger(x)C family spore germination protein n=1 Tax=Faecalispora anaeroviscerum TaxID=2991836 RepID=UPI0024BAF1AB|nr:Ger(x)C family spore germination protein [Faecalispora anaeroviscerum]